MVSSSDIANAANNQVGSTSWAYDKVAYQRGNNKIFPKNSWKCNLFVHDMLYDAGIDPPPRTPGGWPIVADDWTRTVGGFSKVSTQQKGDIVSTGTHVGIAISGTQVVSAGEFEVKCGSIGSLKAIQRYDNLTDL